jgi:drug/metabolite transporter (DMT)-like permease
MSSYARFLDLDVMSDIQEEDDYNENDVEMKSLLIEEADTDEHGIDTISKLRRWWRWCKSPIVVVPAMMLLDLVLGVTLSLFDSNLLRNVPGFRFPLTYALVQKLTNAIASLILIYLSRKWEMDARRKFTVANRPIDEDGLPELPSLKTFRHHASSLTAVAIVQTFSSAFANEALGLIPLPLFKVVLMCGPIFVAFITIIMEGQVYSRGRRFALLLIGFGAGRAVYAEAENADNPRQILHGAAYGLGASAFSAVALVLSSVLMHRDNENDDADESEEEERFLSKEKDNGSKSKAEIELNPLSLLFYLSCQQVMMLSCYLTLDTLDSANTEQSHVEEMSELAAFKIYFAENASQTMFYLLL